MLVIAFVLLVIAAVVFLIEWHKGDFAPWSMLGWALVAFGLALWLYKSTGDLNGAFK